MSNRDLPMMPVFPQNFLTATQHWEFDERAIYILLLMYEWVLDELPNDPQRLARMVGLDHQRFINAWPVVARKFGENDGGGLNNERLQEHRADSLRLKAAHLKGAAMTNEKRRTASAQRTLSRRDDSDTPTSTSTSKEPREEVLGAPAPQSRKKKVKAAAQEPQEFLDFKLAYPARAGDYRWRQAQNALNARLEEGHTWEEIMDGARRYAAYCDAVGKTGTEYVMQASRFVGPDKSFQLPWKIPAPSGPPSRGAPSFDQWHAEAKRRAGRDSEAEPPS